MRLVKFARRLFDFYEARGQAENYIKELKNQLKADRLSSHHFAANCFRLAFVALAYQLLNLFRRRLSNPQLRKAQVQTLRERLFKVGRLIKQTTRRIHTIYLGNQSPISWGSRVFILRSESRRQRWRRNW